MQVRNKREKINTEGQTWLLAETRATPREAPSSAVMFFPTLQLQQPLARIQGVLVLLISATCSSLVSRPATQISPEKTFQTWQREYREQEKREVKRGLSNYKTIHLKYVNRSHSGLTHCQQCQRPHNFCLLKFSLHKMELIKQEE